MTSDDTRTDDDLTGRLTDLLTRSADAIDVRPDLDSVVDAPTTISLVDDERAGRARTTTSGRSRRLALGAVAAAAIVALVAAALAVRDDAPAESVASAGATTTTVPGSTGAPTADVYPVVDEWPAGLEVADAVLQDVGWGSVPGPTAVIGRTDGDSVVGGITVQSFRGTSSDLERAEKSPVTVGGRDGFTLQSYGHAGEERSPTLLLRDGETLLVLTGDDPVGFVDAAPDAVTARAQGDGVDLVIGDLPAPYELLSGPSTPPAERSWPALHAKGDLEANPPPFVFVEVGSGDPLESVVHAGPVRPITIGDGQGWIAEGEGIDPDALGSTYVAWAPTEGITVSVSGAVDRETALAVARSVRLVSRAEWEATYAGLIQDLMAERAGEDEPTTTGPEASVPSSGCRDGRPGEANSCAPPTTGAEDPDGVGLNGEWDSAHPLLGDPLSPFVVDGDDVPVPTGRWSVLVVGGSWCVPCRVQLASIDVAHELFRIDADLTFVAWGSEVDEVNQVLAPLGGTWQRRIVDLATVERWRLTDFPVVLVVDPSGTVQAVATGAVPGDEVVDVLAAARAAAHGVETVPPSTTNPYCSYPDRVTGTTTC